MHLVFDDPYINSPAPKPIGKAKLAPKATLKAGSMSLLIHAILIALIIIAAINQSKPVQMLPPVDESQAIISYLYAAPVLPKPELAKPLLTEQQNTTEDQAVLPDTSNPQNQQQSSNLATQENKQAPVVAQKAKAAETNGVENVPKQTTEVPVKEVLTRSDDAPLDATDNTISVPKPTPSPAASSIMQSSATAIQNIQQAQQQRLAEQEAQAYRQRQTSPLPMPLEQRVDTWESQEQLKVKKIYCDNLAKKMMVAVSFLTRGEMESGTVQCQQLPGFEQYINQHKNKGQTEKN